FVADMLVTRQFRAWLKTYHRGSAFGLFVVPDRLLAHPRHRIDPGYFAHMEILRRGCSANFRRGLDAARYDRQNGCAVLAADAVDASVGPIADIPGSGRAVFVFD